MKNRISALLSPFLLFCIGFAPALSAQEIHACVVMPGQTKVAQFSRASGNKLPPGVQKAVALGGPNTTLSNSNFWSVGRHGVRVKFMGGSSYVRQQVVRYANEWTRYANVNFSFVGSGPSDVRISFVQNGSSWSMLGRQASRAAENQPTMNFGWLNENTPAYEFRRTVLHEFGHALGLLHEHQNPTGGIPWDEEKVYAFYLRSQGWNRQTTYHNVIARQGKDETQYSAYDPASIMHYPVDPQLTRGNYKVGMNTEISATDARFIALMYPGRSYNPPSAGAPTAKPVDRPVNRPVAVAHEVIVSNRLGQGQRAEIVELYVAGSKYVFELREGQRSQQAIRLRLKPGVYPYRVRTASVYTVRKRVRQGNGYVNRRGKPQGVRRRGRAAAGGWGRAVYFLRKVRPGEGEDEGLFGGGVMGGS